MGYNYDGCDKEDKGSKWDKIFNHNHEFLSSTDYERDEEREEHNHRIAGVTGPPIKYDKSHVHKIAVYTDTFDDHFHKICDTTGPALYLKDGKHVHLLKGTTDAAEENNHTHDYYFTTLIEDPSNVPEKKRC